ncbi:MAG: HlyD family efflux transporter periplasmic adaptor subunit [Acaryochloridaceae cyanobacterium RU_4_10]|nr:HlyD family efflux transporter periplasmic adaptor subunit [Acaryochloridaceae cyanobacterium RU_4_10]
MKLLPRSLPTPDRNNKSTQENDSLESNVSDVSDKERSPRNLPLKPILYGVLGIAACLGLIAVFRPAPIPINTGRVEQGNLQVTVNAEGKTRVRDRFTIAAPINGYLDRIQLDEGNRVEKGALVARIDPLAANSSVQNALSQIAEWRAQRIGVDTQRPKTANLKQAQLRIQVAWDARQQAAAKVTQAQADLEQARRDKRRSQELAAAGTIPRQARETAELNETTRAKALETAILAEKTAASEVNVAQAALTVLQQQQRDPDYLLRVYDARIASVEAQLSKLRDEAARTNLYSPSSGKILRILQKSAQFVAAGTPLLEVGNPAKLELVIDVLSADALKIHPSDIILIDRGTDVSPIQAKVRRVEPSAFTKTSALGVEEQRVNVIGDFIDPSQFWGDAYRVETRIVVWEGKNILKVPLSALFRCKPSWCVFAVRKGKGARHPLAREKL